VPLKSQAFLATDFPLTERQASVGLLRITVIQVLIGLLVGLFLWGQPGEAATPKRILVLGEDSYIPTESVQAWAGAEVQNGLGEHDLLEFTS
jgi:hypothetical protein